MSGSAGTEAINDWERYLSENGFRIVKLFLNLSKEEQRMRFLRRIDLPEHNWKFSSHDVQERRYWDAYQEAFSEMFTSHEHRVGAVVRDPGRPQVVRARRRRRGDRARADRHRPAVPDASATTRSATSQAAKRQLEDGGARAARPRIRSNGDRARARRAGNRQRS